MINEQTYYIKRRNEIIKSILIFVKNLPEHYMMLENIYGINDIFLKSKDFELFLNELFDMKLQELTNIKKHKNKTSPTELIRCYFGIVSKEQMIKEKQINQYSSKETAALTQLKEKLIKDRNQYIRTNIDDFPNIREQIENRTIDIISDQIKPFNIIVVDIFKRIGIKTIKQLMLLNKENMKIMLELNKTNNDEYDNGELIRTLKKIYHSIKELGLDFKKIKIEDIEQMKEYVDDCYIWNTELSNRNVTVLNEYNKLSNLAALTEEDIEKIYFKSVKLKEELINVMEKFGYTLNSGNFVKKRLDNHQKTLK